MSTSVTSAFDWWARTAGDRRALVFPDDSIGYRDLRDWASRAAQLLQRRGVTPGSRVGIIGGNTVTWAIAAHAVIRAGAVIVPVNARLVAAELALLVETSGATHLLMAEQFAGVVDDAALLGAAVERIGFAELDAIRDGGPCSVAVERAPDEPVAVLFTSGSTGRSKGVICTTRTLLDIVFEASLREAPLTQGCRSLMLLPLSFTPGLVWGLIMIGVLGGTLHVEAQLDPDRAVQILAREQIQVMFGVPLIYQALSGSEHFAAADLSSLELAAVGGAAVPPDLLRTWRAKGVGLRQIYGMTEIGGIATATLPADADDHPDSCGVGSVFTDFMVVRADGSECNPEEVGEIVLRGPGMTPGYWEDPQTTAQAFHQGWLHSGDYGRTDADGRLTFVDRMKDIIISGGINISPFEIESVLARIPHVLEVAVIPAKDDKFGETPAAIVVADAPIDPTDVVAHCGNELSDYKIPRYVVVRDEPLPRLPSGKISKPALRGEYDDLTQRFPRVR